MIKAVVWDIGGVLFHGLVVKEIWEDREGTGELRHQFGTGKMPQAEFEKLAARLLGISEKEFVERYRKAFSKSQRAEDVIELYKQVRCENYILSDTNPVFDAMSRHMRGDITKIAKKEFLSHEVGIRKVSPDLYKHIIKEIGYKPEEILVIDDQEAYVRNAKKVGLNAILFKNSTELKKDLKSFGVI